VKTVLWLVVGYFVLTSMKGGGSSANSPKPQAPQPQSGGGDTYTQIVGLIRQTAKTMDDAIANDRGAPNGNQNPT
jgi:hypothetical protein